MKLTNCSIRQFAVLAAALALAGCGGVPRVEVQEIKVPVPVECREFMPFRPTMPTEVLPENPDPFVLLRAALSEIDRREGYENSLRTALDSCIRPLSKSLIK